MPGVIEAEPCRVPVREGEGRPRARLLADASTTPDAIRAALATAA